MTVEIKLILESKEDVESFVEHLDECSQYHWGKLYLVNECIEQIEKQLENLK